MASMAMLKNQRVNGCEWGGVKQQGIMSFQRGISLPPKVHEDDEPEYIGMWHVDGHREDVAAVVLHPGYI